jgi:Ca-activated chloride channel family protein
MVFQPIANPILLGAILVPLLGLSFWLIITSLKTSPVTLRAWIRRSLAIILIGVMCFRPGLNEDKQVDIYTNQYNVYFVVDTTASMVAEDWDEESATRLSGVKKDIGHLVDEYSGAKFTLITFDSEAVIRTPLTKDATALMTSVKNMSPEITKNSKGSSPWLANELLTTTLQKNTEGFPDRANIVFMFTDGEKTSSDETTQTYVNSADYVQGGMVYGYGTEEGGEMKKQNGYYITSKEDIYIKDESSTPPITALSKIDETNLKTIAEQIGINYNLRSSSVPIESPELSEIDLTLEQNTNMRVINDYTWVAAFLLCILLSFELSSIILAFSRLRKTSGNING